MRSHGQRDLKARRSKIDYALESERSGRSAVSCVRKWDSIPMEGVMISGFRDRDIDSEEYQPSSSFHWQCS